MQRELNIIAARDQLVRLVDEMERDQGVDAITITKPGIPVMVVLPYETYEALVETVVILGDSETADALRRGMADMHARRVQELDDVRSELG